MSDLVPCSFSTISIICEGAWEKGPIGHNNYLEIWALKVALILRGNLGCARAYVRSTARVYVYVYVCSSLSWTHQLCEQFERATAEYRYDHDVQCNRADTGDRGSFSEADSCKMREK